MNSIYIINYISIVIRNSIEQSSTKVLYSGGLKKMTGPDSQRSLNPLLESQAKDFKFLDKIPGSDPF